MDMFNDMVGEYQPRSEEPYSGRIYPTLDHIQIAPEAYGSDEIINISYLLFMDMLEDVQLSKKFLKFLKMLIGIMDEEKEFLITNISERKSQ